MIFFVFMFLKFLNCSQFYNLVFLLFFKKGKFPWKGKILFEKIFFTFNWYQIILLLGNMLISGKGLGARDMENRDKRNLTCLEIYTSSLLLPDQTQISHQTFKVLHNLSPCIQKRWAFLPFVSHSPCLWKCLSVLRLV